ncbi:MAG TPA: hypothetical protein VHC69_22620 [Polyangiaceae bacterium]|nr:hypothetical protein [Polyangiaceae bacterium]
MTTANELFESDEHRTAFFIGAAAVVVGLCLAAWVSWTCDDAFISFRYAQNLVQGHGLVYNAGERVEGYTNLLWTLFVAAGLALGAGAEPWADIFGLVAYGGVLVLLFSFHLDLRRALPIRRFTLPVACLVAAAHADLRLFATSGLETSAFTFGVLAGYTLLARGLIGGSLRPLACGAVFGVCTLLRPDGMVFAAVAAIAIAVASERRTRDLALFAGAVGVFWAGATLFRIAYYGAYVPNTYYAKSAYLPWHAQGLVYLGTYLQKYNVLLFGAVAAVALSLRRAPDDSSAPCTRWYRVHAGLSAAFTAAYTYYVVRVGGDFMYARLLIPVTPYLAILLELALYRVSLTRGIVYVELVVASLVSIVFIPRPVSGTEWQSGIADESAVYDDARTLEAARDSEALATFFRGLPVRVAFLGTEARVMYQANVPVAIEADTGLTDAVVARQPLRERGRIGHEKHATPEYLVSRRAAQFLVSPNAPDGYGFDRYIPTRTIELGPVKAWILTWDPALMTELAKRGAVFGDFEAFLDGYIETLPARATEDVRRDYDKFRHFYFEHVRDPEREAPFVARLGSR